MKPSLAYTLVVILNIGLGALLPSVARADGFFKTDSLPPLEGKYISPAGFHAHYQATGVLLKDVSHSGFSTTFSPPTAGNNQLHNFGSSVQFQVSMDGGATFSNVVAPASVSVRVTHASAAGTTRVFDTEMLQLDITGGDLPPGVALRESPALVSPGLSTVRSVSGGYRIESFFDVFTELSLDGGQTWDPATNSVRVTLTTFPSPPLISIGSVWKYLDDGSNPGVDWHGTNFNDSLWATGPAQLGYGDGDESTTNGFGTNANNKFITTYYRHAFVVNDATACTNLLVRLLRDDGGVVYLNGVEVFRSNMPTGAITAATLASVNVPAGDESTNFYQRSISPALLQSGTNVIAVEIHQVTTNSSDLSFDLELVSNFIPVPPTVNLTSPANGANLLSANILLTAAANDSDGDIVLVEFFDGGTKLGEDTAAPYSLVWPNPQPGTYTLTAVATDSQGLHATSAPVTITVTLTVVPGGAIWKYLDDGSDQGMVWTAPDFDDSSWTNGPAQLGYGDGDEMTVINGGPTTNRITTSYFRHSFVVSDISSISNLVVRLLRDDGAVVYLNGQEVFRSNMTNGPVNHLTPALAAVDDNTLFATNVNRALLQNGTNVVAAEVHQFNNTSSDVSFDLELIPNVVPMPPMVSITSPANNATIYTPANVTINATATDFDDPVAMVQFYIGNALLATDTTAAYSRTASNVMAGTYTIWAVAIDNSGLTATSAPVNITIIASAITNSLISTGAMWRFLDDGSNQGTNNWIAPGFDDGNWRPGTAKFGFGDPATTTIQGQNVRTVYFRHAFVVTNAASYTNLAFRVLRDDGVVVYLNGSDLFRMNMTNGVIDFTTPALAAVGGTSETAYFTTNVGPALLMNGTNVLAVELHQTAGTTDAGFDLGLTGIAPPQLAPARPLLAVAVAGEAVVVTWAESGFVLQMADDPAGPYMDVTPLVTSGPYPVITPAGSKFYRLRQGP